MTSVYRIAIFCSLAPCAVPSSDVSAQDRRPNIVIILADDLGRADVGFSGGREIQTPQIDKLAASGARLEQFYVQPVCTPTRAALMTGRYPMRYGLQSSVIFPWSQYGLPLDERTLPQALKHAGYATAIIGKWHLGHFQRAYLPTKRGFDRQYGSYLAAVDYFTHDRRGGHDWHRDDEASYDKGYSTHLLAAEAAKFIREKGGKQPFFLYVPMNAAHTPHQVPEEYVAPYAHLDEPRRTYAGMITAMDEAIGQILAALDEKRLRKQTLIIFSSDNGGFSPGRVSDNGLLREGKGTLYEGGVRVAASVAWEGHIKSGTVVNAPLHIVDWYPTLLRLAGVSIKQKLPLDGRDAWAAVTRGGPTPHTEILLNATPNTGAIRVGDWKLVLNGAVPAIDETTGGEAQPERQSIELFDLVNDPYEKHDLSEQQPERVKELLTRYSKMAAQATTPKFTPQPAGFKPPKVWGEMKQD